METDAAVRKAGPELLVVNKGQANKDIHSFTHSTNIYSTTILFMTDTVLDFRTTSVNKTDMVSTLVWKVSALCSGLEFIVQEG